MFDPYNLEIDEKDQASKIEVLTVILTDTLNFEYFFKATKRYISSLYSKPVEIMVGDKWGLVQSFGFPRGYISHWDGEIYYCVHGENFNGVLTIIMFDALGGSYYSHYKKYFDHIIRTIKIADRIQK